MAEKKTLYTVLAILSLLLLGCFFYSLQKDNAPFVWQNYTSSNETLLSVLIPEHKEMTYFIGNQRVLPSFQRTLNKWMIHHLLIKNLDSNKNHELIIEDVHSNKSYTKRFHTLDWNKSSFTIAVASCMDDRWNQREIENMWNNLLSFKPDLLFLIGDNVYADKYIPKVTPRRLEERYIETFTTLPLYQISSLLPILAIWDDHDYGMNNGHGGFQYKSSVTKLFRDFFPLPKNSQHLRNGPGISFRIQTKNQNFFFMDGRSYRSKNSKGSLWGRSQEEWFLQNFFKKDLNWIVSGGQIFGKHHRFESFEKDFPNNFNMIIKKIIKPKKKTLFISGDRHLGELLKFSTPDSTIYEITTSPIHGNIYPKDKNFIKSDRHIHHIPNKLNFAIIHHQMEGQNFKTEIQLYGLNKTLLLSEKIYEAQK